MRTLRLSALLATAIIACSGNTDSDGKSSTGGQGGSSGQTSTGGTGGGATGGTPATGGSSAGGGSGGSLPDASLGGAGGTTLDGGVCAEGGASDASVESAIATSCSVAVIEVARIDGECSGAGGEHITFDVLEIGRGPGITKISTGGHAYYAPPEGPNSVGQVFVAGIDPFGKLVPRPDNPSWCLTGLPAVDGFAHTLLRVKDATQGSTKMKQILGP